MNSELEGNSAEAWGSAIHVDALTTLRVWNSLISGNQADNPNEPIAAISAGAATLGGGVVLDVVNSTIVNNVGGNNGGGIRSQGTATVHNSIIWANSPGQIDGNLSGVTVEYSIVEGGWTGSTNSGDDPKFVNAEQGNYRLLLDSPAIDAGWNNHLPCDEYNIAPGVAGLEAEACEDVGEADGERHPIDLDVRERVRLGEMGTVDIGAYELQCESSSCPGDLNQNDTVNVQDLLALLGAFGPCGDPGNCAEGDLNCDGVVNVSDLVLMLGYFGTCPTQFSPAVAAEVQACLNEHGYEVTQALEDCLDEIDYD